VERRAPIEFPNFELNSIRQNEAIYAGGMSLSGTIKNRRKLRRHNF
jgi:hypothetical protein